jgi:hypothetical protein
MVPFILAEQNGLVDGSILVRVPVSEGQREFIAPPSCCEDPCNLLQGIASGLVQWTSSVELIDLSHASILARGAGKSYLI